MINLTREQLRPKFVLKDGLLFIPKCTHVTDAGADLRAWLPSLDSSAVNKSIALQQLREIGQARESFFYNGVLKEHSEVSDILEGLNTSGNRFTVLSPGQVSTVCSGFKIELPDLSKIEGCPYVATYKIMPRSGLAIKCKLTVINSPGIIDAGYRDWVGIGLFNQGPISHVITHGARVAQGLYELVVRQDWEVEDLIFSDLTTSDRVGGFGSSGTN
jgi:deoxyuridine 5'-triphosphate nucleotidohydrolase